MPLFSYYALSPELVTDLSALFIADSQFYRAYWNQQQLVYRDCWNYWTGLILQNTVANQSADLEWPLRINLVQQAVLNHALLLWGVNQEGGSLVSYHVQPKRTKTEEGRPLERPRKRAKDLEEKLNDWLRAARIQRLLTEQGRLYGIFGGCFLRALPDESNPSGVQLSATPAEYVFPVWNPNDYNQLLRLHVARRIPVEAAVDLYGYAAGTAHQDVLVDYVETWTPETYSIQVGTGPKYQEAHDPKTGRALAGGYSCRHPVTGRQRLPWVYVPRLRSGRFYGLPLPQALFGIQDEYNTRMADIGDATTQITHPTRYGHDLPGPMDDPVVLPTGPEVFNAGRTTPGGEAPQIVDLKSPELGAGLTDWTDGLLDLSRYMAHISPVLVGLDEGSQRSGETLNIRAIPTTSMIQDYRIAWNEALADLAEIYLMLCHGLDLNGITEEDFDHEISAQFQPVLPKDRAALVEETVTLKGAKLRSRKLALRKLGDVPDIDEELAEIQKDEEAEAEAAAKAKTAGQPDPEQADQHLQEAHDQQLAHDQESHDQKLQHSQEEHDLKMRQAREKKTSQA